MRFGRPLLILVAVLAASAAHAQSTLLNAGARTPGHAPMYSNSGTGQPIAQDSGTSGGGAIGANLSELGITSRSPTNAYPSVNSGHGPNGEHACLYDGPTTNATGYHYFCMDPNAAGGGLISYGKAGTASALPFSIKINGTAYEFPFSSGGVVGPTTSTIGDFATWNNTTGTWIIDSPAASGILNFLGNSPMLTDIGATQSYVATDQRWGAATCGSSPCVVGSGGDDSTPLNAAISYILANGGGTLTFPAPPSGAYNVCSEYLNVSAPNGADIHFIGPGEGANPIRILPGCGSPPAQVFYVNDGGSAQTHSIGRVTWDHLRIDGYGLATHGIYINYAVGWAINTSVIRNSAASGDNVYMLLGYEGYISPDTRLENVNDSGHAIYTNPWNFPAFNLVTYGTDSHYYPNAIGAYIANFAALNGGANKFFGHGWGYPAVNGDSQVQSEPLFGYLLIGTQFLTNATADSSLYTAIREQISPNSSVGATEINPIAQVADGGTGGTPGLVNFSGTTGTGTVFQGVGWVGGDGVLHGPVVITQHGLYSVNPTLNGEHITGTGVPSNATLNITIGSGYDDQAGAVIVSGEVISQGSIPTYGVSIASDVYDPVVTGLNMNGLPTGANCIVSDNGSFNAPYFFSNPSCTTQPQLILGGPNLETLALLPSASQAYISCANADGVGTDPCYELLTANGSAGAVGVQVNNNVIASFGQNNLTLATTNANTSSTPLTLSNPSTASGATTVLNFTAHAATRATISGEQSGSSTGGLLVVTCDESGTLTECGRFAPSGGFNVGSSGTDPGVNNIHVDGTATMGGLLTVPDIVVNGTVSNGIDLSSGTFATNQIKGSGFTVGSSGLVTGLGFVANGTTPYGLHLTGTFATDEIAGTGFTVSPTGIVTTVSEVINGTASNLLDLSGGTASVNQIKGTGFTVDPSGNVVSSGTVTATGTNGSLVLNSGGSGNTILYTYNGTNYFAVGTTSAASMTYQVGGSNVFNLSSTAMYLATDFYTNNFKFLSVTAPTIASGFGTSPSIAHANGTASFQVVIGTGGTASTGTLTMPAASDTWSCTAQDNTTFSTTVFLTRAVPSGTTSVVLTNYSTAATAAAWAAGDTIQVNCTGN